jgi:hypothetical protein
LQSIWQDISLARVGTTELMGYVKVTTVMYKLLNTYVPTVDG